MAEDKQQDSASAPHQCRLPDGHVRCIWQIVRMAGVMIGGAVIGAIWCVARIITDWIAGK